MMYQMQHINLENNSMKCVICKDEILGYSHNAEPVANGKCCERCNHNVVIPTRIKAVVEIYKKAEDDIIHD